MLIAAACICIPTHHIRLVMMMGFVVLQGLRAEPVSRCRPKSLWYQESHEGNAAQHAQASRVRATFSAMYKLPWFAATATSSMFVTCAL